MQTNLPGVFARGDLLCIHIKQAAIAAADGVIAAIRADWYIHGETNCVPIGNKIVAGV
jgi:thioredoxin reductase (NADPH)